MDLPVEIWFHIFQNISLRELSKLMYTNRYFYTLIKTNKWKYIDNLINKDFDELIPKTKETFNNFKYCIDWVSIILKNETDKNVIPDYVLEWIDDRKSLEYICIYQKFSEPIIRKLFNKINWKILLTYQNNIPLDLINFIVETYDLSRQDWNLIWLNSNINLDFVISYNNNVEWHTISSNKDLISFELIEKYGDRLSLHELTKHGINENIVIYYLSKMDIICWTNVSQFTKLSMDFIKKHIDKLNLQFILKYQEIDEFFLEKLINKLDEFNEEMFFQSIALNQKLSYNFILKYKDSLYIQNLIRNKRVLRNDIFMIYN